MGETRCRKCRKSLTGMVGLHECAPAASRPSAEPSEAAYNVYAIQFAFAAFRKLTSLEEAGRYREAVRAAVLAYLAHLPASEALALSARPAAGSETRDRVDAERYRFLRDNPIQFRAVDGAAHFWGNTPAEHIDRWTDAARLAAVPPSPDATTGTE